VAKKIAGTVYLIADARQTSRVVDVEDAFSDSAQAKAQILYAESSGDKRQLKLARLAYRQFQGKRYRVESKPVPRTAVKVDQEKTSKRPRKKLPEKKPSSVRTKRKLAAKVPAKRVSEPTKSETSRSVSKVPVARTVGEKVAAKPSKPPRGKPLNAKQSKKPTRKRAAKKVASKIGCKPSKGKLTRGKSQKEPARKAVAKRSAKVASKPPKSR